MIKLFQSNNTHHKQNFYEEISNNFFVLLFVSMYLSNTYYFAVGLRFAVKTTTLMLPPIMVDFPDSRTLYWIISILQIMGIEGII